MLALFLVDHLCSKTDSKTLHHFCDSTSQARDSHGINVLLSLIWQLIDPADVPNALVSAYRAQGNGLFTHSSFPTLLSIFKQMCDNYKITRLNFVLDAVDECDVDSMRQLLQVVACLSGGSESDSESSSSTSSESGAALSTVVSKCSSAVFSRTEETFNFDYTLASACQIDLQKEHAVRLQRDVEKFVHTGIRKLAERKRWSANLKAQVEAAMIRKSEGLFLWASFVLRALIIQPNATVLDTIEQTPQGLMRLYECMLVKINKSTSEVGRKAIQWVIAAQRRLRVEEVFEVMNMTTSGSHTAIQIDDVMKLSYGFLQVAEMSGEPQDIGVCHASALQFLRYSAARASFLDLPKIDLAISQFCLDYLGRAINSHTTRLAVKNAWHDIHMEMIQRWESQMKTAIDRNPTQSFFDMIGSFQIKSSEDPEDGDLLLRDQDLRNHLVANFPMFWYAARWWPTHLRRCEASAGLTLATSHPLLDGFRHNSGSDEWRDDESLRSIDDDHVEEDNVGVSGSTVVAGSHNSRRRYRPLFRRDLDDRGIGRQWWDMFRDMIDPHTAISAPFTMLHLSIQLQIDVVTKAILQEDHKLDVSIHRAIDCLDAWGTTPLMLAAKLGNSTLVRQLLAAGANIMLEDHNFETALRFAAQRNDFDCTLALLQAGADCQHYNRDGNTPVDIAVQERSENAVRAIASHDVTQLSPESTLVCRRQPPLHAAAQRGDYEMTELLLLLGSDIHIADAYGNSVLHALARSSFDSTEATRVPADVAALHPLRDIAGLVVAHGISKDCRNERGQTPLMLAAAWANTSILDFLLEGASRALVNAKDEEGVTALLAACYQAQYIWLRNSELFSKCSVEASYDHPDERERGPAKLAHTLVPMALGKFLWRRQYQEGEVDAAMASADPFITRIYTPIVDRLLEKGADISATIYGLNCLHLALLQPYGLSEVAVMILQKAPVLGSAVGPLGSALHLAVSHCCLLALRMLDQMQVDFNIKDASNRSVLYHLISGACAWPQTVVKGGNLAFEVIARRLTNSSAVIDDEKLLHLALMCEHRRGFIRQLLDRGANYLLQDDLGNTALHYAAALPSDPESAVILLDSAKKEDRAAFLESRNREGYMAVLLAAMNGNVETTEVLSARMTGAALFGCVQTALESSHFEDVVPIITDKLHDMSAAAILCQLALLKFGRRSLCWNMTSGRYWMMDSPNGRVPYHARDVASWKDLELPFQPSAAFAFAGSQFNVPGDEHGARSIDIFGLFPDHQTKIGYAFPCCFGKDCCDFHQNKSLRRPLGLNLPSAAAGQAESARKMGSMAVKVFAKEFGVLDESDRFSQCNIIKQPPQRCTNRA